MRAAAFDAEYRDGKHLNDASLTEQILRTSHDKFMEGYCYKTGLLPYIA